MNHNNTTNLPIYEPGLEEIILNTKTKNLSTAGIKRIYPDTDMVFISK